MNTSISFKLTESERWMSLLYLIVIVSQVGSLTWDGLSDLILENRTSFLTTWSAAPVSIMQTKEYIGYDDVVNGYVIPDMLFNGFRWFMIIFSRLWNLCSFLRLLWFSKRQEAKHIVLYFFCSPVAWFAMTLGVFVLVNLKPIGKLWSQYCAALLNFQSVYIWSFPLVAVLFVTEVAKTPIEGK